MESRMARTPKSVNCKAFWVAFEKRNVKGRYVSTFVGGEVSTCFFVFYASGFYVWVTLLFFAE